MPIAALLLAAATPLQTVTELYAPFSRADMTDNGADAHWSAETGALVRHWKQVTPNDEIDELGDFDWLCHCQDWDAKAFRARVTGQRALRPDLVEMRMRIALGWNTEVSQRLLLRREGGDWRVDDILASDLPGGLKATLRRTIAADLRRKTR